MDLPDVVTAPFEVFVNGVPQRPGVDYDQVGRALVFRRLLQQEGRLGFWRWLSLFFGVAGTYRKHENVDVQYTVNGKPRLATGLPVEPLEPDHS